MRSFLLFFLVFSAPLWAQQQQIIQQTTPQSIFYTYQNVSGASAMHVRNMLREFQPQGHQQLGFELAYTQEIRGFKGTNNNRLDFQLKISNIVANNLPLSPSGFNFQPEFVPERVRVTVELRRSTGELLSQQTLNPQDINNGSTNVFNFTYTDTINTTAYQLVFTTTEFIYTNNGTNKVKDKAQAITAYQGGMTQLLQIERGLQTLQTANPDPDSLGRLRIQLDTFQNQYNRERAKPFWRILALDQPGSFDPQGLVPTHLRVRDSLQAKQNQLAQWQGQLHVLHTNKADALYRQNQKALSRPQLNRALSLSPQYPPALLLQSEFLMDADSLLEAKAIIQTVLNQYANTAELQQRGAGLATRNQLGLQTKAQTLLSRRSYAQALQHLDAGLNLCQQTNNYICTIGAALEQQQRDAAFAWYEFLVNSTQQQLQQSQTAFATQNYALALSLADSALALAEEGSRVKQRYANLIGNDLNLPNLRNSVVDQKYQSLFLAAEMRLVAKSLDEALDFALKAEQLAAVEASLQMRRPQSKEQVERVQYQVYLRHVAQGDSLKAANQNDASIKAYQEAKKLDQQYGFSTKGQGVGVEGKIQDAAKEGIVRRATQQLNSTDNEALEKLLAELKEEALKYQLSGQNEVISALSQLQQRICQNASTILYPNKVQAVKSFRAQKDYGKALEEWKAALAIAQKYRDCNLDQQEMLLLQAEIEACAQYQSREAELKRKEQTGSYRQAITDIEGLNVAYQNALISSQLPRPAYADLFQYLQQQPQPDYTYEGSAYFLDKQQFDESFTLLKLALERKISPKKTRFVQERLGTWKAGQVFVREKKWKQGLTEVIGTQQKPWKYFSKTFKKKWNSMK